MLILPAWSVAVLVSLVMAILGFSWKLATKAEKSSDKLETTVDRLVALEGRLAVINVIEKAVALLEQQVEHLEKSLASQDLEVRGLRDAKHSQASSIQKMMGEIDRLNDRLHASSNPTPVQPGPVRRGSQ